jgi:hypothetical protein
MSDENLDPQAYACAIGSAILALNTAESELADLLQQLGRGPEVEGWWFSTKVAALKEVALKESDPQIRAEFDRIVAESTRLGSERNNFAHSLLWFDPFKGTHHRRYARLDGPKGARRITIEHDERSPQQMIEAGLEIDELALSIGALATRLRNR